MKWTLRAALAFALTFSVAFSDHATASLQTPVNSIGHAGMLPVGTWTDLFARQPNIVSDYGFNGDQFHAFVNLLEQVDTKPAEIEALGDEGTQQKKIHEALARFAATQMLQVPTAEGRQATPSSGGHSARLTHAQAKNLKDLALISTSIPYLRQSLKLESADAGSNLGEIQPNFRKFLDENYVGFLKELNMGSHDYLTRAGTVEKSNANGGMTPIHVHVPPKKGKSPVLTDMEVELQPSSRNQPGETHIQRLGPKPMQDPIVMKMESGAVDETMRHFVSHSYRDDEGKTHLGTDLIQLHVEFLEVYGGLRDIADTQYLKKAAAPSDSEYLKEFKKMKDKDKHVILKYYEIGDDRIVDAVKKLVDRRIKITVITDFNQSLVGERYEKKDVNFEKAGYRHGAPGEALKKFIRMGFKFGKEGEDFKFTLLSGVPLFDPTSKGEKDLMHDKVTLAWGPDGKPFRLLLAGTANLNKVEVKSPGPLPSFGGRVNAVYVYKAPASIQTDWNHVMAEIAAFKKRDKFAQDIHVEDNPEHRPIRIQYPDGTYKETAFTDSIQNTNERIMKNIQEAIDSMKPGSKKKIIIKEIFFAQFVLTNTAEVELLRQLMKVQPWVKVWGLFDQQFIWLDGWGQAGALAQFLVMRPFGRSIFPFPSDFEHRMELYGYQRLIGGTDKIDLDAAPMSVHLMHRKLTGIKRVEMDVTPGNEAAIETMIAEAKAQSTVHVDVSGWSRERIDQLEKEKGGSLYWETKTHAAYFNPGALDKIIAYAGDKNQWTHVWERSFNNSNHYQNLESQDEFRLHGNSVIAKQIEDGVKLVVKSEPEWALPLNVAIARDFIARFVEHTPYDIDVKNHVVAIIDALKKMDYEQVGGILKDVSESATISIRAAHIKDVAARTKQFVNFLNWYAGERNKDRSLNEMTFKKAVNVGWALALSHDPYKLRTALDVLYYHPNRTPEKRLELMRKAWNEGLEMNSAFPGDKEDKDPTPDDEPIAKPAGV